MKYITPFTCLHPIKLSDGSIVPCRQCEYCLSSKSQSDTLRCDLESKVHKYCYFVTLTYSNSSIPVCRPVVHEFTSISEEPVQKYVLKLINRRLCNDPLSYRNSSIRNGNDVYFDVIPLRNGSYDFKSYYKRTKLRYIPVLCSRDIELFLKKIRNYISKIDKNAKIRYYIVGEYGPRTLRPHYHVLFWFDSDELDSFIRQIIRKAWTYGNCHTLVCDGKASSYVASYVGSRGNVPQILKELPFRSFCRHSINLGTQIFVKEVEKVYALPIEDFVKPCVELNGKYTSIRLWRSFINTYFPRCVGYSKFTPGEIYSLYTIYSSLSRKYMGSSCSDLARYFYDDLATVFDDVSIESFRQFFVTKYNFFCSKSYEDSFPLESRKISDNNKLSNLYNLILFSRHFVHFICNNDPNLFWPRFNRILKFYSDWESLQLSDMYKRQIEFVERYHNIDAKCYEYFRYFYDNYDEFYKDGSFLFLRQTDIFKRHIKSVQTNFKSSMKHKELNDELGIFIKSKNL